MEFMIKRRMNALRTGWGAHAARVLVAAARRNGLFAQGLPFGSIDPERKFAMAGPPSPAREVRAGLALRALPRDLLRRL